eukprot:2173841-Rhodomonas_salina.1
MRVIDQTASVLSWYATSSVLHEQSTQRVYCIRPVRYCTGAVHSGCNVSDVYGTVWEQYTVGVLYQTGMVLYGSSTQRAYCIRPVRYCTGAVHNECT